MATPSLHLRRLSVQAFRSIVDKQEVELPGPGLHLIDGPSGHGKTSFVEAVNFVLGCSSFPSTELQSWSWLTDDPMLVSLDLQVKEQDVCVSRGKKASLSVAGQSFTGASVVAEKLPGVLGLHPDLLRALTYRQQRSGGYFLGLKDSERKKFLVDLLHLGQAEAEVERTTKLLTSLEKERDLAKARYEQALSAVPPKPEAPQFADLSLLKIASDNAAVSLQIRQANVESLTDQLAAKKASQRRDAAKAGLAFDPAIADANEKLAQAKAQTYSPDPESQAKLEKLQGRLKVILDGMAKFRTDHQALQRENSQRLQAVTQQQQSQMLIAKQKITAQSQLTQAQADLDQLEAEECFTCHRPWADENLQSALVTCKNHILQLEAVISNAVAAEEQLAVLAPLAEGLKAERDRLVATDPIPQKYKDGEVEYRASIASLQTTIGGASAQFLAAKAAQLATLNAELKALQAQKDSAIAAMMDSSVFADDEDALEALRREVSYYLKQGVIAKDEYNNALSQNKQAQSNFESQMSIYGKLSQAAKGEKAKFDEIEKKLLVEEDFHGLVKSFLNLVFDETLVLVAAKATDLLEGVPNAGGITLSFVYERETNSGTTKHELKLVVNKDGHDIPFRSGLSGGQQSVVELVVDLALGEVVADRIGIMPGFLFLDEPFDGLDADSKEAMMAVLAKVAETRAVFCIDHSTTVKEMFSSIITVSFNDGKSTIAVG